MTIEEREKLFNDNMGLVYMVAKRRKLSDDAIQEGLIALWLASLKFDETRGVKFSSYAVKAIENRVCSFEIEKFQSVTEQLDESQLPADEMEIDSIQIERVFERVLNEKDCQVFKRLIEERTQTDIAKEMGVSRSRVGQRVKRGRAILREHIKEII